VTIPQKKGDAMVVDQDEHPRETSLEALAKLKGVVRPDGTVTAGNASGRERRRLCPAAGRRGHCRQERPDPKGPRRGHGHGRGGAAHHGHWPGAGHAEGAGSSPA
jgi:hypothetical protein